MSDIETVKAVQDELEERIRTAVVVWQQSHSADRADVLRTQVARGRRAVALMLREPVDVEALAVGTTFKAPHINLKPTEARLWVRTEGGITDLSLTSGGRFDVRAVDPKAVYAVQAPSGEEF